jgi:hypothetical protein
MSKGRNRERQNAWDAQAQTQNAAITQRDPLEVAYRAKQQKVLDWENSNGKDIRNMPGMDEHIQIGQAALARANQDRQGMGAFNLADGGSSGYAAQLKEQKRNELGQQVGAGLEEARAGIHAEAAGSVLPFSQLSTSRNIAQANHSAGMFSQWNQRQSKNWWDYLREGVQIGGQAAGMAGF